MTRARRRASTRPLRRVPLARALSRLGVLTRSRALSAIQDGRVEVNGRTVRDPRAPVDVSRAKIQIDGEVQHRAAWRTIMLNKPRGIVTTKHDPKGRATVYSLIDADVQSLVPVGRLDLATSGLLLLTTDTALAAWLTDPHNAIPRLYVVTVRGRVTPEAVARMRNGMTDAGERLAASSVTVRKASGRESHLVIELREGKNREVRRLCEHVGHDVTRLKRVAFGNLELGTLAPGSWRDLGRAEVRAAYPRAPLSG